MESVFFGKILATKFDLFQKGMEINQHKHEYDHISILVSGEVSVIVDNGPENIYQAPSVICIKKNSSHKIISMSDNTVWFCIFALYDIDGNISDHYELINIPKAGSFPSGTEPASGAREKNKLYKTRMQELSEYINILNNKIEQIKGEID
jgi:hypothetical protein